MDIQITCLCMMFGALVSTGRAEPRQSLSLDGIWDFATDLDNRGEFEKWFRPGAKLPAMPLPGYGQQANGKICVPGVWDNQGYGTATDKVHHNFVGKGWYKRQVEIPQAWNGRRIFLTISGVSRYAKVWVDGQWLGEHIGYLSSQEYDISKHVAAGKTATITIQVDSKQRWEVDSMYGCSSLADYMDVAWGGIWGHVSIEARSDCWLSDLFIQPNLADSTCAASATLNGNATLPDHAKLEVFGQDGRLAAETTVKIETKLGGNPSINVKTPLPNAALWTPDASHLYRARLSLIRENGVLDIVESRFGMRQFSIDGPYILLNGRRIMLRGYGDDHVYLEQMAMPSDKDLYLRRLRIIKAYGFNFVRNHSAIMPPEYYEACDEIGMIATAEFPICYETYLPGTGFVWKAHSPPLSDPKLANDTSNSQWAAAIRRCRNHPSIVAWVRGNELYDPNPQRAEFQRIARPLDPTRFYIDSDSVALEVLDPKNDRDTLDFYTVPFAEGSNPLDNPAKFKMVRPKKPVISHESGNYITFSRPSLIDEFKHNFKPFWLTAGKAKLEELGLAAEADQWAEKSERLYVLCHKYNTEAMRANPFVSGYQWWLFQDYWTTANGIVDLYFRPKAITLQEILKINNDVVLLQEGIERTYRGKSRLNVKLLVSNYAPNTLQGRLAWEVTAGDRRIAAQELAAPSIGQGAVVELAPIALELPDVPTPAKLTLSVHLDAAGRRFDNDWSAWLYSAEIQAKPASVPRFADATLIEKLPRWGLAPIPAQNPLNDRAVYLTRRLDRRLVDALDRGASVVLLGDVNSAMHSRVLTFRSNWWKGTVFNQSNHTGTFVYDHPVTRATAPDGWCDVGWFHLVEGSRKYSLDSAPARPQVIIRALPTFEKIADEAIVFEVGVGKGCLIVSGLNHEHAQGRPENQWLLAQLLDHAARFSQPKPKWPASFLLPRTESPAP